MIKYALSYNENVARKCIYSFFMHEYVKTTKPLAVKGDCPPRQAASGLHFDALAGERSIHGFARAKCGELKTPPSLTP